MTNSDFTPRITIHTDGACTGNPGPGGWGAVICYLHGDDRQERLELSGGETETTNNRMELSAVIRALSFVQERDGFDPSIPITIISDSKYVVDGFTVWRPNWKLKNWRTADKKPVKNQELWRHLEFVATELSLSFQWVKGHAGDPDNEAADALANAAIPTPSFA